MKFNLTLLVWLLASTVSFAQYKWTSGTIFLSNGVKKSGQVRINNNAPGKGGEVVLFRTSKKGKKEKYYQQHIKRVELITEADQRATFEYIQIGKKSVGLFQILTRGKVVLYSRTVQRASGGFSPSGAPGGQMVYTGYGSVGGNEFYVKRSGEKIATQLISVSPIKSFKKAAREYFNDCTSVLRNLDNNRYKKKNVIELVNDYNQCN